MPAGARRIGAEPVALQAHRHVRDAHVLAGVLDAVVVVVLPYHTGDVRLGDAEQAVAVGQRAEPVQVGPLVVADQRRHAGLVGLVEALAAGVVVVGQVRLAGGDAGLVGDDLLHLLAVLDRRLQVQQVAGGVLLVLAEDGVVALLIHVVQIVLGGCGDPGEHLGHVVVAVDAVAGVGVGIGPSVNRAGSHDPRGEGLDLAAVALARLSGVPALGLGDVDDRRIALVAVAVALVLAGSVGVAVPQHSMPICWHPSTVHRPFSSFSCRHRPHLSHRPSAAVVAVSSSTCSHSTSSEPPGWEA